MATVKICDGRTQLFRWDTGVKLEMCGCASVTECHFVTTDGVIRRDVEDNICDVPDVALTKAGLLVVYAYARTADEGVTRHEFRITVQDRPKPADYIDPPDEYDNLQAVAERVTPLVQVEETDPTVPEWAKQPEKPTYTAQEVGALPADAEIVDQTARQGVQDNAEAIGQLSEEKANKADIPAPYTLPAATADTLGGVKVGEGLTVDADGVVGAKKSRLIHIETYTFDEDSVFERTQEADGTPYALSAIHLQVKKPEGITIESTFNVSVFFGNDRVMQPLYFLSCSKTAEQWMLSTVENCKGLVRRTRTTGWDVYNSTSAINEVPFIMYDNPLRDGEVITHIMSTSVIPAGLTFEIWGVRA